VGENCFNNEKMIGEKRTHKGGKILVINPEKRKKAEGDLRGVKTLH